MKTSSKQTVTTLAQRQNISDKMQLDYLKSSLTGSSHLDNSINKVLKSMLNYKKNNKKIAKEIIVI